MTNNQIRKALLKYSKLNTELLDYTSELYDSVHYDMMGFYDSIQSIENYDTMQWSEFIDTEALQNQIKALEHLIQGYKLFNPTYA